jgi:hypothetical protein
MAITQAVANSFKKEILEGIHDLESGGDVFKLALYKSTATLSADTIHQVIVMMFLKLLSLLQVVINKH